MNIGTFGHAAISILIITGTNLSACSRAPETQVSTEALPQPDAFDKNLVLRFLNEKRWAKAKNQYLSINRQDYDMKIFDGILESQLATILSQLPAEQYSLNIDGYEFLIIIRPDDADYRDRLEHFRGTKSEFQKWAFAKLTPRIDKVEVITWYDHPRLPQYYSERSGIGLYFGRRGNGPPGLQMVLQYTANDWLFVDKVYAWYDGSKKTCLKGDLNATTPPEPYGNGNTLDHPESKLKSFDRSFSRMKQYYVLRAHNTYGMYRFHQLTKKL